MTSAVRSIGSLLLPLPLLPLLLCGLLPALLLGGAGCSTYQERVQDAIDAYRTGQYDRCASDLETLRTEDASNRHLYDLNLGMAELARGRPKASIARLRDARDRMGQIDSSNLLSWFGAMLTDDTALDYAGEDYERILTLAMLAIADLMHDKRDADAYALQVWQAQQDLIDDFDQEGAASNPKKNYKLVGFGSYLRGILNEDDPTRRDVARREFKKLVGLEPTFRQGPVDLARLEKGRHTTQGYGAVYVLGLVGLGPTKIEVDEPVSSQALVIAQYVWNLLRERISFPVISSVKIPALVKRRNNPTELHIDIDGKPAGTTETVTDVESIALQQFKELQDWVVARAVLRRVFKLVVIEGAKEAVNRRARQRERERQRKRRNTQRPYDPRNPYDPRYGYQYQGTGENPLVNLGIDLLGNLWTAVERADTRCWSLLPAKLQARRLELPVGEYTLDVHAGVGGRPTGATQRVRIRVRDGYNTYVLAIAPTPDGGPPPLTSDGADEVPDQSPEAELELSKPQP